MLTKSKKKNIGKFRQRVEVQKQTETDDGMGGQTVSWTKDFDLWCNIKPVSGNQKLHLDAIQSTISHTIQCRYGVSLSNENRISYKGRIFNVHYQLTEDEENAFIEMGASELK